MDSISDGIGHIAVRGHHPLDIELSGEFDISNVSGLQSVLDSTSPGADVRVAAGGVTFASAALLNCLIGASTRLTASGHQLIITPCSALLLRLLTITSTTDMVRLES